jgi:hypothetical protein
MRNSSILGLSSLSLYGDVTLISIYILYICIYICVCVCVYIYMYIYKFRLEPACDCRLEGNFSNVKQRSADHICLFNIRRKT